jgi:hypothetical protein
MRMKAKITLLLLCASALALSACDYCPRGGTIGMVPWYYPAKPNKYPIPVVEPCGPVHADVPLAGPLTPVN